MDMVPTVNPESLLEVTYKESNSQYLELIINCRLDEFRYQRSYEHPYYTYYIVVTPFKGSKIVDISDIVSFFRKKGYERICVTKEHFSDGKRINPHFNVVVTTSVKFYDLKIKKCNIKSQIVSCGYKSLFQYIYKEYYEHLFDEYLFCKV